MAMLSSAQERPEVADNEQVLGELVKRIRKLRWIGMDDEADQVTLLLRRLPVHRPFDTVLAGPTETD